MNIIVAAAENNAIGYQGQMPWHLSADLKYFKATTMGHAVIMGRKTYESIGRPLPGRRNIIVTRDASYAIDPTLLENLKPGTSVEIYTSLDTALAAAPADAFVIGGAQIYNLFWPHAEKLYITRVHIIINEYDAAIPAIPEGYKLLSAEDVPADEKNDYSMTFEVWERPTAE